MQDIENRMLVDAYWEATDPRDGDDDYNDKYDNDKFDDETDRPEDGKPRWRVDWSKVPSINGYKSITLDGNHDHPWWYFG